MLIWLDESVLDADLATDHDACCGVSALFYAVYRGEHYVLGRRTTLTALALDLNLSLLTRRTIETILVNIAITGGITEYIASRLKVKYGNLDACKRIDASTVEVSLSFLGIHGVKKTVILTENLNDARAFEHAAKQYQVATRLPGQVTLDKSGGGGSTTPIAFKNFTKNEQRWCLCITDSDRFHPAANMDTTAQKCRDIGEDISIVAAHIDISAREIENILPIAFLDEVIPPTHQTKWEWHIKKLNKIRPDVHKYCDIKKGTTLRKIRTYAKDCPNRAYWELVVADLNQAAAITSDCVSHTECEKNDDQPCVCFIGHGFGDRLLESVVEKLDHRTPHQSEKMIRRDPNYTEWMEVGCKVYEWCCAPQKMRL